MPVERDSHAHLKEIALRGPRDLYEIAVSMVYKSPTDIAFEQIKADATEARDNRELRRGRKQLIGVLKIINQQRTNFFKTSI